MFSKTILIGRVGAQPKINVTREGKKLASFSLATEHSYKRNGERVRETTWHRINVLNDGIAGIVEQYVQQGDILTVEGRIQKREYEDKNGAKQVSFEIAITPYQGGITLMPKSKRADDERDYGSAATTDTSSNDFDDEIPF